MVTTIAEVLNQWNDFGVFSYALPFVLIFAIVFGILEKTKLLTSGERDNRAIEAIIAAAIGLLALQFDFVSEFYSIIFPSFGVGISVFIVLILMLGLFYSPDQGAMKWIGWFVGIGTIIYAFSWYDYSGGFGGSGLNLFGGWFNENFWALAILALMIGLIAYMARGKKGP